MGTSDETPKKISSQKGQGMLEYALMMSFVAMIYLIVFAEGGIGGSILEVYNSAAEMVINAAEESDLEGGGSGGGSIVAGLFGGGGSSSGSSSSSGGSSSSSTSDSDTSSLVHTAEQIASEEYSAAIQERIEQQKDYELLDWVTLNNDIKLTFETIINGNDPDKAIASEYNLFFQLAAMTNNKQEYIYGEGATTATGWNDLISQMKTQIGTKQTSSYVKKGNANETLKITRNSTGDTITMTYTDGSTTKAFSLYADNNLMQFKSEVTSGGTTTTNYNAAAITEYGKLGSSASIYNKGVWEFNR